MSRQEPEYYNLEFFGDAPFWAGAGDSARRTFLMPLPNPIEFLAFGVFGPSSTVHFVARGRLREHVGDFTARMVEAGATVELYERPPLPWALVKRYISDEPYEHREIEGPKEPPVQGFASYGGGADDQGSLWEGKVTLSLYDQTLAWPALDNPREVIIVPSGRDREFLAMAVCLPKDSADKHRFVFAARGSVDADLGNFITRMRAERATVRLHDWPPQTLVYLRAFLKLHFGAFFSPEPPPQPIQQQSYGAEAR